MRVPTCVKLGDLRPRHGSTRASPRKNSQHLPGPGNLIRDVGAISGYIGCILLLGYFKVISSLQRLVFM
jgi:hypothetical protein